MQLPPRSRDELPPSLAGLQGLWTHPTLQAASCARLEAARLADTKATGRRGLAWWPIGVWGVVRLGWEADWDRLEPVANSDTLVRQRLGRPLTPGGAGAKVFAPQTLRDPVARLADARRPKINALGAAARREVFAKKGGAPLAALELKTDR